MAENCAIPEARYGREDAAAKIIHLSLGNPDIKAKAIEETYRKRDLTANHDKIKAAKRALSILSRGFSGRGVFFKKYSIISVTTAIIELLDEYSFTDKEAVVADALQAVEAKRKANDKDPADTAEGRELTMLTAAARSDRADHIKFRRAFYRKVMISAGITPVDTRRAFSSEEKAAVYFRDGKCCRMCRNDFSIDELEVDHVVPFSRGGLTTLENAQLLCVSCNRSKGATMHS